ncbi:MAG: hypothetical protein J6D08_14995 [Lachnospiraceae bacterium]|nr:hypothetical protein [Lachnospiraceae bacterium]
MEYVWKLVESENISENKKIGLFLCINIVLWAVVGYWVWAMLQFYICKGITGALCFSGYAGFFIGFVGGVFFLWKKY